MLKISKSGCRWIYTSTSSVQELLTELTKYDINILHIYVYIKLTTTARANTTVKNMQLFFGKDKFVSSSIHKCPIAVSDKHSRWSMPLGFVANQMKGIP